MPSILVTGATGNVGAEVVRQLQQARYPVKAAVRDASARPQSDDDVTWVSCDFMQPASYQATLEGVDSLFLMRPPALTDTKRYINPLIDAAQQAGVQHIVFLSLLGAEKLSWVPHRHVETYLQGSGVAWTLLRAGFFMQNLSTIHRDQIRADKEILVPAGTGATSFIDVRDIAAVAVKALTEPGHRGQAYPLTGAEALDYYAVARVFSEVLGRPITYRNPSIWTFIRRMRQRGVPLKFVLTMVAIYLPTRFGRAGTVTPDTAMILDRPPITMRQFVEDHRTEWFP